MIARERLFGPRLSAVMGAMLTCACVASERQTIYVPSTGLEGFALQGVRVAERVLPGGHLLLVGRSFVGPERATAEVEFVGSIAGHAFAVRPAHRLVSETEIEVALDPEVIVGIGRRQGPVRGQVLVTFRSLVDDSIHQDQAPVAFELVSTVQPILAGIPTRVVHLNVPVLFDADGILLEGEGETSVVLDGMFVPALGRPQSVVALPVTARTADPFRRTQGEFPFATSIGGIHPGTFEGTARLRNRTLAGEVAWSAPVDVSFELGSPVLSGADPPGAALGEIVLVRGTGFVGDEDRDEVTILHLEGTFATEGQQASAVTLDLVPGFVSGELLRFAARPVAVGEELVAEEFGVRAGIFDGTATVLIRSGAEEEASPPWPFRFQLEGTRQIVWVRFLAEFRDSLELFGLREVEQEIRRAILEKMRRVYRGFAVELRDARPTDFEPSAFATLEIGGPDPNGSALFGFDNTPGKDVFNLRLYDYLGGENAQTQADGFPGYGGIFVQSYLWYSRHPPFAIARPEDAPPVEPRFDETFDPVREAPVLAGELSDSGGRRRDQIAEAIRVLGNLIGDTAAHELGHSLGLANPYGLPDQYHNPIDGEGCLMDAGGDRPFYERAELDGTDGAGFCGEEQAYLQRVLPVH